MASMGKEYEDGTEEVHNSDLSSSRIKGKRAARATLFIYALVGLEHMGFVANMVSFVLYFSNKMYFDLATAANTLTTLIGSTFLLSIIGGFISDTYINRFHTCLIFGTLEVLALSMMTIQAHTRNLLPTPCGKPSCMEGGVAIYFYTTLCLLALGTSGVRGSLPALGADQFDPKDPKEARGLATYFNWLMLSTVCGGVIGVTLIVWISTNDRSNHNWWKGFLITAVTTFLGFVILAIGKPFYRLNVPKNSPFVSVAQVIIVAVKNRRLPHRGSPDELYEINIKDSNSTTSKIVHTHQFRCLDKAAILPRDTQPFPWKVCTVTQVEEVKILTRMMPILASTIILNTCMAQLQTFSIQQGYRMDSRLGSFKVPAASMPVIPLLLMVVLLPIYNCLFVPLIRKHLTGHPSGITQLQRVGVGLALSTVSMCVAALVEVKRRRQSLHDPSRPISMFWLALPYGIFGTADMFTLVGLLEFFYREAPDGMKSLSTSFAWISLSCGYFLSSLFVDLINMASKRVGGGEGGGRGWLHGKDLDEDRLDLFYWFLGILSGINFLSYVYWATWYKYKNDEGNVDGLVGPTGGGNEVVAS